MSQWLRVVRADRRGYKSRLVAEGTTEEIVSRARRGDLRSDDLIFGLAKRALLARDVTALAPHVPGEREAELTRSLRAGVIGAGVLLPVVLVVLATFNLDAVIASAQNPSREGARLVFATVALPLGGAAYSLVERRRLRALRRASATRRVELRSGP